VSFISTSPDFPLNKKYSEIDSTNMNILMKIDMNEK